MARYICMRDSLSFQHVGNKARLPPSLKKICQSMNNHICTRLSLEESVCSFVSVSISITISLSYTLARELSLVSCNGCHDTLITLTSIFGRFRPFEGGIDRKGILGIINNKKRKKKEHVCVNVCLFSPSIQIIAVR